MIAAGPACQCCIGRIREQNEVTTIEIHAGVITAISPLADGICEITTRSFLVGA